MVKGLFLIALSKVDFTGLKHDACRKVDRSCFVLFFLMMTPSLCCCVNTLSAVYWSLIVLLQSLRSINGSITLNILMYFCSGLLNNLEVLFDGGSAVLYCLL